MTQKDYDEKYYHTDIDYLDLSNTASLHECTGLIPEGFGKPDEDEQYKDIYAHGTPLKCQNCHRGGKGR